MSENMYSATVDILTISVAILLTAVTEGTVTQCSSARRCIILTLYYVNILKNQHRPYTVHSVFHSKKWVFLQVDIIRDIYSYGLPLTYVRLLNKPYENQIILRGHNILLKSCQPLEILTQFTKELDLLLLKIQHLQIKGLQSYWPSNFENDLTPGELESGPTGLSGAGRQTFS